jgi:tRNA (mo5U34)-methyltransferase
MTLQSPGAAAVAGLGPWFHNLHLPGGAQTAPDHPLGDFPAFKWRGIAPHLPADLTGCRALDIGCNAGFYSFELARRGATVVGIDTDEHYLRQARWAAGQFQLSVDFRRASVYDLARWDADFDLVLFLGVFYHLRYPVLALDLVVEKARGLLVFQTLTTPDDDVGDQPDDLDIDERGRLLEPGWPRMAFVEHRLAGDPTNWWVPNAAAVEALLRTAGVDVVARPGHEIWLCQATRRRNARTASRYGPGAST